MSDAGSDARVLTRRGFIGSAVAFGLGPAPPRWEGLLRRARPTPTPAQLAWQREERALFVHFGMNTFTDREWGDGTEDPALFQPSRLDPRGWARAARAAGLRAMILTAKHHDGFCLWPTRTTGHSVAASPWRGGAGDVVRGFVEACRAEGLRAGLYCSPWDRNAPSYGDSPRYNDLYVDQLTELLGRYGPIHGVWFDGANGEGPQGRSQDYDWPRFWSVVRHLQPDAVIFSDAGPDVRWIGNESGSAGDPNWSTVDPSVVPFPGATGEAVLGQLQHGDPDGSVWRPGETDVDLGRSTRIGLADLREDVRVGQSVVGYRLEKMVDGARRTLSRGLTVGYRKLDRWEPVRLRKVRLRVEDGWGPPPDVALALFAGPSAPRGNPSRPFEYMTLPASVSPRHVHQPPELEP